MLIPELVETVRYYKGTEKGERKMNKYFEKAYREMAAQEVLQSKADIVLVGRDRCVKEADKIAEVLGMSVAEVQALAKKVQA